MSKKSSRRDFLYDSAKIGTGLFLTGCASWDRVTASVDEGKYEFIVVGSGAGGGTLAARLARLGHKVLLIEAGSQKIDPYYNTPAFHGLATENMETSWKFFVKHHKDEQRNLLDSKFEAANGGVFYPRASGLGGCTTHHAMITMVPDDNDWQRIADLSRADTGSNNGWVPAKMREHFVRLENNKYLDAITAKKWGYGTKGWLSTEKTPIDLALKDETFFNILSSSALYNGLGGEIGQILGVLNPAVGLDTNRNMGPRKLEGLYQPTTATLNGRRRGPREWLLETAQETKNLTIITNAFVTQLLFDPVDTTKVVGVEYREGSYLYQASAKYAQRSFKSSSTSTARAKEVILAGGAFNTPQILMLSGIGDFDELPAGVTRRLNLPGVGKNLQDRYEIGVICKLKKPIGLIDKCKFVASSSDPCYDKESFALDANGKPVSDKNAQGQIYATNGVIVGHIKKSSAARTSEPDLFVFSAPGAFRGYETGWSRDSLRPDHFTWAVLKAHTKNSGTVKLNGKDPMNPFARPDINFNYYENGKDDPDLQAMVEGVKLAREVNKTQPLKDMVVEEVLPGYELEGDDLKEFIMNESWGHHASCTAKMGTKKDPMAVCDFDFKVRGTTGLRIVDASVFPQIPGMFIVVPIYMIAEKAAEAIHIETQKTQLNPKKKKA